MSEEMEMWLCLQTLDFSVGLSCRAGSEGAAAVRSLKGRDLQYHSLSVLAEILPRADTKSFVLKFKCRFLFCFRRCPEVFKAAVKRSLEKHS